MADARTESLADLGMRRLDQLPGLTGSAPATGITLAVLYVLAATLVPFAFYRRRNVQPCRSRRTAFMLQMLVAVTVMNATYIAGMITETACLPSFWVQDAMVVAILTIYLTRTFVLFFQHRTVVEQRILSTVTGAAATKPAAAAAARTTPPPNAEAAGGARNKAAVPSGMWFLRHRYLLDPPYLFYAQFAVACVAAAPTTTNTFLQIDAARGWSALQCVSSSVFNSFQDILLPVAAAFLILYTCLAAQLARYGPDNLGIRLELKIAGVVVIMGSAATFAVSSLSTDLPYPVQDLTVVICGTLLLANSFLTPVFLSYKYHQHHVNAVNTERFAGSFQTALASPETRAAFRKFCEKEFSAENLMFYEDVEHFRSTYAELKSRADGETAVLRLASEIVNRYVATAALYEINVAHGLKNTVNRNFQDANARSVAPDVTIFDAMQKHIFQLMATDSFSRFLCSDDAVRRVVPNDTQNFPQI